MVDDCRTVAVLAVATLAIVLACETAYSQSPDRARLKSIESRILPPTVVEGAPRLKTLPDFYKESNKELSERLERAKAVFKTDGRQPFRMVTLIAGDAGIGKTFIKQAAFKQGYPKSAVHSLDIKDLYRQWEKEGIVQARPDLYAEAPDGGKDGVVLSRLLAVGENQPLRLRHYLNSKDASIFLIDSLDEIHPNDYLKVLEQVERFVFDGDRRHRHVVVFGRSVAFRDYWHNRSGFYSHDLLNLYLINPPRFKTTGDLLVSTWNYHCFHYKLKSCEQGGEPQQISFEQYAKWARAGYPQGALGMQLQYRANRNMDPKVAEHFRSWAGRYRIVNSTIYNLAGNSLIREISQRYALSNRGYDEDRVMGEYLQLWLKRDSTSSNRPSSAKPEHLDLYMRLLEEVAAKYASGERLASDGFFSVHYDDVIVVQERGRKLQFPVYRILDRSGLMHADPRQPGSRRYRFEPIWLHRHLLDRYRARSFSRQD